MMSFGVGNLSASPCGFMHVPIDESMSAFREMGYTKFEAFSHGAPSALDPGKGPDAALAAAKKHGLTYSSAHLPKVGEDLDVTEAVSVAKFAVAIGAPVVLYKAVSRSAYIKAAAAFLDAIEDLPITPVLQNHFGTPISTLEDFREVIDGINDPRMKTLLEVGHFEAAGIPWERGYELLSGSIALVHVKDMRDRKPVPFGTGNVDLPGLFRTMDDEGYTGDFVIEMETEPREERIPQMGRALEYLKANCLRERPS
jgi:sugar phosphate isomerase/epimerase